MDLYESLESNGKISLMELFDNPNLDGNVYYYHDKSDIKLTVYKI